MDRTRSSFSRNTILTALLFCGLLAACATNRPAGEQLSDGAITTKIKSKLTADPQVNATNVDVDTLNGVVTLRGEVEKEVAKSEAEKLAAATRGVVSVRNLLQVVPPAEEDEQPVTDAWIATKIKSKLTADSQLNPLNIDVDVEDGHVTLSGVVASEANRAEAEKLTRDTKGVTGVSNELEIKG